MLTPPGTRFELSQFADQIVVLSFVSEDCGTVCEEQQALVQLVQQSVNDSAMRDMVEFVTVSDNASERIGWEAGNWHLVFPADSDTEIAARTFATLSDRDTQEPLVHVLDRGGRHAGIFHGARFGRMNMMHYINGLTNAAPPEPGVLERLLGVFR